MLLLTKSLGLSANTHRSGNETAVKRPKKPKILHSWRVN